MSVHKYKRPALLSYIHVPPNLSATTDSYFVSLPQREPDNWLTDLFNTVAFELHDGTLPIRARVKITSEQAHAVRAKYSCADTECDAMVTPWVTTDVGHTTQIEIFRLRAHTDYNVSLMYSAR